MSKCKSTLYTAAPLGISVKILRMTLFKIEKKKVEIVKMRMKIQFLHKYIHLIAIPFLNDFNRIAQ